MSHLSIFLCLFGFFHFAKASEDNDYNEYRSSYEILVVFLVFGIALGAIFTHGLNRLKINLPYTVVMFINGMIVSFIVDHFNCKGFGGSVRAWSKLDPEMVCTHNIVPSSAIFHEPRFCIDFILVPSRVVVWGSNGPKMVILFV